MLCAPHMWREMEHAELGLRAPRIGGLGVVICDAVGATFPLCARRQAAYAVLLAKPLALREPVNETDRSAASFDRASRCVPTFLKEDGFTWTTVEVDEGETIPDLEAFDAMMVMGGPQDVWQEGSIPGSRPRRL